MFLATHVLVSGLIAEKINNPIISYPSIFVAHFLMDRIPHWDFGSYAAKELKYEGKLKSIKRRLILALLGGIDISIGIIFCWFLLQKTLPINFKLWGGVFFGLLPDFLGIPPLFLNWRFSPFDKIENLHSKKIHRSTDFIIGIIPQIIILILVFWLH